MRLAATQVIDKEDAAMRVLVVDDNVDLLGLLSVLLEDAGCDAVTTSSAGQALALAAGAPFALMITDLQMPGMDGLELIARIRALPGQAALPVMVMSGHPLHALAAEPLLFRLEKPFSVAQFNQLLGQALPARAPD